MRLARSRDYTYNGYYVSFWCLGEVTSGFLAMCLPVFPRFFQSLKEITIPSWIPISRYSPRPSSKDFSDGYLPRFKLPRNSDIPLISAPVKQVSSPVSRPVGPVSLDLTPKHGPPSFAKLEPGDSVHISCNVSKFQTSKSDTIQSSQTYRLVSRNCGPR